MLSQDELSHRFLAKYFFVHFKTSFQSLQGSEKRLSQEMLDTSFWQLIIFIVVNDVMAKIMVTHRMMSWL
jgi:hypothetical protein